MHFASFPPIVIASDISLLYKKIPFPIHFYSYTHILISIFKFLSLQGGLGLAITVYTAVELTNVEWNPVDLSNGIQLNNLTSSQFCALGKKSTEFAVTDFNVTTSISVSDSNCLFLEILGGCTIGLAIVIGIIQCYTCRLCGLGGILDFLFAAAGTAAWCVASLVVTNVYNNGNDSLVPVVQEFNTERKIVMIMCWVEFGLFVFIVFAAIGKCCCCKGRDKGSKEAA